MTCKLYSFKSENLYQRISFCIFLVYVSLEETGTLSRFITRNMAGITKGLSFVLFANIISNRYFSKRLNKDDFIRNTSLFLLLTTSLRKDKKLCMDNMAATDTDMVPILKKIQLYEGMYTVYSRYVSRSSASRTEHGVNKCIFEILRLEYQD